MKKIYCCILIFIFIISSIFISAKADVKINIGDYIQMGKYYDELILWRCVDIDENGPLILSDKIICLKPYDAGGNNTEGGSSHGRSGNRKNDGSNFWEDSNIRSWLNSTEAAGKVNWMCQNPPNAGNVVDGYNDYANEKGFLADGNFSNQDRSAIKTVIQKSLLSGFEYSTIVNKAYHRYTFARGEIMTNYDVAYSSTVTDKVFLLDVKQIERIRKNFNYMYYKTNPTQKAVDNSEFKSDYFTADKKWYYWLRSPRADNMNGNLVRSMDIDGGVRYKNASVGNYGIRPAFYLTSVKFVSGDGSEINPYSFSNIDHDNQNQQLIKVIINGEPVQFDQAPIIENDRTLVPMRAIFEAMGSQIFWDESLQKVTAIKGVKKIELTIGQSYAFVNNTKVAIDVPAKIINNRTLVPVRFIAESMGAEVNWDENSNTVIITTNKQ